MNRGLELRAFTNFSRFEVNPPAVRAREAECVRVAFALHVFCACSRQQAQAHTHTNTYGRLFNAPSVFFPFLLGNSSRTAGQHPTAAAAAATNLPRPPNLWAATRYDLYVMASTLMSGSLKYGACLC